MDDYTERRPHRPLVTDEAVMLAIETGANCPHKLARVFDVHILHPDLHHICLTLTRLGFIRGSGPKHTEPGGWTCTPVEITELARPDAS